MTLETRIHELCRKAITANELEIEHVIAELKTALREHNAANQATPLYLSDQHQVPRDPEQTNGATLCGLRRRWTSANHYPSDAVWDTLPPI